jgi:hypothetical protein
MSRADSDIIEVKLSDPSHTLFFKGKARISDKKDLNRLNESLEVKSSINIVKKNKKGWFD